MAPTWYETQTLQGLGGSGPLLPGWSRFRTGRNVDCGTSFPCFCQCLGKLVSGGELWNELSERLSSVSAFCQISWKAGGSALKVLLVTLRNEKTFI